MDTNIYLLTAFAFMSCDGEIAPEEIQVIRDMHDKGFFPDVNLESELDSLVRVLNVEGKNFLKSYLDAVDKANLSSEDALKLLQVAVKTVYADTDVRYSEVKFFRATRQHLHALDDDFILENIPEIEDFWLASDTNQNAASVEDDYFNNVELPQFDISAIK